MLVDNSHNTGETDYDLRSVLLRILHLPQTSVVCNSLDNADVIFKENLDGRYHQFLNLKIKYIAQDSNINCSSA